MFSFLLPLALKLGIPARFAKFAVIAALVALGIALLGLGKCAYDRSVIKTHDTKIQERARPATDKAAEERARDTITQAKNEQEAHNAVHSVPDAAPAAPSHALACQRLRKLGRNPPACR